jgi:hypothetical protein
MPAPGAGTQTSLTGMVQGMMAVLRRRPRGAPVQSPDGKNNRKRSAHPTLRPATVR